MKTCLYIYFFTVLLFSCNTSVQRQPLIKKDTSTINEKNNTLFAFVGEKISLDTLPYEEHSMDEGFLAKYKILQRVYGDYAADTIEFRVYDHYGIPPFSKYKNVLLYVSKSSKGYYYHEKYQYNDVYKTKDGKWAGPYSYSAYSEGVDSSEIKPEPINFVEAVIKTREKYIGRRGFKIIYKEPYYKLNGDTAVAVYGNYIEDLFKLKRDGVLTARGLFGQPKEIAMQDIVLENISNEQYSIEHYFDEDRIVQRTLDSLLKKDYKISKVWAIIPSEEKMRLQLLDVEAADYYKTFTYKNQKAKYGNLSLCKFYEEQYADYFFKELTDSLKHNDAILFKDYDMFLQHGKYLIRLDGSCGYGREEWNKFVDTILNALRKNGLTYKKRIGVTCGGAVNNY